MGKIKNSPAGLIKRQSAIPTALNTFQGDKPTMHPSALHNKASSMGESIQVTKPVCRGIITDPSQQVQSPKSKIPTAHITLHGTHCVTCGNPTDLLVPGVKWA